jgi:hypothetical protein
MSRHIERTAYCQEQAAECAKAAFESTIVEVKEAYMNLEQGWLQLAPELGDSAPPSTGAKSFQVSPTSKPEQPRSRRTRG